MNFVLLLRCIIELFYACSRHILTAMKKIILYFVIVVIKTCESVNKIALSVTKALDGTINLEAGAIIDNTKPQECIHWINHAKISGPRCINIQQNVILRWNYYQILPFYGFEKKEYENLLPSVTRNPMDAFFVTILNALSKNHISTRDTIDFIYIGFLDSLPEKGNNLSHKVTNCLAFLLCDDMSMAYERINSKYKNQTSTEIYECFRAGRTRKIHNWDLKVLAVLILMLEVYVNSLDIAFTGTDKPPSREEVDEFVYPLFQAQSWAKDSPALQQSDSFLAAREVAFWSLQIYEKLDQILSPFRIKMYKMFAIETTTSKRLSIALHSKFYGKYTGESDHSVYSMTGVFPLKVVSKMMADGHIHDAENLFGSNYLGESFGMKMNTNENDRGLGPSWLRQPGAVYVSRGACLIINQEFHNNSTYQRNGSLKDVDDLFKTWSELGCKDNVEVISDVNEREMMTALKRFRQRLTSILPDFMVLVILSHGKRDEKTGMEYILDIDLKGVPLGRIKNMFIDGHKCRCMIGKPKLFFIQACRGTRHQTQDFARREFSFQQDSLETDGEDDVNKSIELNGMRYPHKSWFLIFHSTIKGFVSNRDPVRGSIFIQELCKEFNSKWFLFDISRIAAGVNKRVMEGYDHIQAPLFENQLGLTFFNVGHLNR